MVVVNAASLVVPGMLSVMLFPAIGLRRMRRSDVTGTSATSPVT
jgi:hypothetical protein